MLAAKGDANETITFEAVGRSLSQWEFFEAYYGLLFGIFVFAGDNTEPALRAYGTVQSFKGRSAMVVAAARAYFLRSPAAQKFEPQFKEVVSRTGALAGKRNEIAHGIVQPYFPDGKTRDGWALVPSYHATSKRALEAATAGISPYSAASSYAYVAADIEEFRAEFETLAKAALEVYRALFGI